MEEVDRARENMQRFVEHMIEYTARLVCLDQETKEPLAVASGFFIRRPDRYRLLTAGHAFDEPGIWGIETGLVSEAEHKTLLMTTGAPHLMAQFVLRQHGAEVGPEIDFAWVDLTDERLRRAVIEDAGIDSTNVKVPY